MGSQAKILIKIRNKKSTKNALLNLQSPSLKSKHKRGTLRKTRIFNYFIKMLSFLMPTQAAIMVLWELLVM